MSGHAGVLDGFSEQTPLSLMETKFAELSTKIAGKYEEVADGQDLAPGAKTWVTRWSNGMDQLTTWITAKSQQPSTPKLGVSAGSSGGGDSKLKAMWNDFAKLPELNQTVNVEVFTRRATTIYNTHVKTNKALEAQFIVGCEQRLCTEFRVTYQAHCETVTISSWDKMAEYLLDKHQSSSTVFQEVGRAMEQKLDSKEQLRDIAARVSNYGNERLTVIKAKYKRDNKTEMNVDNLWELLMCQVLCKEMQASTRYARHYAHIAPDMDGVYTVESLTRKADYLVEREVNIDALEPRTFIGATKSQLNTTIDKLVEDRVRTYMGKRSAPSHSSQPGQSSSSGTKAKKRKTIEERMQDPEWLANAKKQECHAEAKYGVCKRPVCPYIHQNQTQPRTMVASRKDFLDRVQQYP